MTRSPLHAETFASKGASKGEVEGVGEAADLAAVVDPAVDAHNLLSKLAKSQGLARSHQLQLRHLEASETLVNKLGTVGSGLEKVYASIHSLAAKKQLDGPAFTMAKDTAKKLLAHYEHQMQFAKAFMNVHRRQTSAPAVGTDVD